MDRQRRRERGGRKGRWRFSGWLPAWAFQGVREERVDDLVDVFRDLERSHWTIISVSCGAEDGESQSGHLWRWVHLQCGLDSNVGKEIAVEMHLRLEMHVMNHDGPGPDIENSMGWKCVIDDET